MLKSGAASAGGLGFDAGAAAGVWAVAAVRAGVGGGTGAGAVAEFGSGGETGVGAGVGETEGAVGLGPKFTSPSSRLAGGLSLLGFGGSGTSEAGSGKGAWTVAAFSLASGSDPELLDADARLEVAGVVECVPTVELGEDAEAATPSGRIEPNSPAYGSSARATSRGDANRSSGRFFIMRLTMSTMPSGTSGTIVVIGSGSSA